MNWLTSGGAIISYAGSSGSRAPCSGGTRSRGGRDAGSVPRERCAATLSSCAPSAAPHAPTPGPSSGPSTSFARRRPLLCPHSRAPPTAATGRDCSKEDSEGSSATSPRALCPRRFAWLCAAASPSCWPSVSSIAASRPRRLHWKSLAWTSLSVIRPGPTAGHSDGDLSSMPTRVGFNGACPRRP